jgi:2-desacetyl-2-hydroxyethyl bacteriochlorophyllide A dehydrogenase
MRAVVLDEPGAVRVGEVDDPTPGHGEVVVQVGACGICGTDLHIVDGEFPPTPYPIIPGHEFAGRVVALGPGLPAVGAGVEVGDRVAVDPSLFCGRCSACRAGRGNLCHNWNAIGDTVNGAFAEYVALPAANAYRIPAEVDDQRGALIEPLSCAVHGMHRLGPVLDERVLLIGAGTMGLLLLQLLGRSGASSITVVDRKKIRTDVASDLGASAVANDVGELDGERYDVAVDATGAPQAVEAAFGALERGGKLMVFGVSPEEATVRLSPFRIYNDEITIIGSMAVLHSFGKAVGLMASGAVESACLLAPLLPLARWPEAVEGVRRGEGLKVQVAPGLS